MKIPISAKELHERITDAINSGKQYPTFFVGKAKISLMFSEDNYYNSSRTFYSGSILYQNGKRLESTDLCCWDNKTDMRTSIKGLLKEWFEKEEEEDPVDKRDLINKKLLEAEKLEKRAKKIREEISRLKMTKEIKKRQRDLNDALLCAAELGDHKRLKVLFTEGANPNIQDYIGRSPLHYATIEGHIKVVRELLRAGADPNLEENAGWTPIHAAEIGGHYTCADLIRTALRKSKR